MKEETHRKRLLQLNRETFVAEARKNIKAQRWDQYLWSILADDFRLKRANPDFLPQDKRQMIAHIQYDQNPVRREIVGEPKVFLDDAFGVVTSLVRLSGHDLLFHNLKVFSLHPQRGWQCVYWQVSKVETEQAEG
jgi:hypothetical protein